MKRIVVALLAGMLLVPSLGWAIEVAESALARKVEQRQPVDVMTEVPADIGRLYCFTRLVGADSETRVVHVWSWEGREMARVELPVRSSNWRTWSSKRILPEWSGAWTISILDAEGNLLKEIAFQVR